jgi:hypothetical protein
MVRSLISTRYPNSKYSSLESFLEIFSTESQLISIDFSGKLLDLLYIFKGKEKPLLVFFGGALDQSKTLIPHFTGTSYASMLDCNVLSIADSSLYYDEKLRSCFYLGCKSINLQLVLPEIIDHIRKKILAPKVVLYGSSGGGFAVLAMSQLIHNVHCIVNCPATSVSLHPNKKMVEDYFRFVWGAITEKHIEEVSNKIRYLDFRKYFNTKFNNIYIFINKGDHGNIEKHFIPFADFDPRKTTDNIFVKDRVLFIMDDWGSKHMHPPARLLHQVFNRIIRSENGSLPNVIISSYKSILDFT